jgi:hypothetical protein
MSTTTNYLGFNFNCCHLKDISKQRSSVNNGFNFQLPKVKTLSVIRLQTTKFEQMCVL